MGFSTKDCVAKINETLPGKWKRVSKSGNAKSGIVRVFRLDEREVTIVEKDGRLELKRMVEGPECTSIPKLSILFSIGRTFEAGPVVWFADKEKFLSGSANGDDEDEDEDEEEDYDEDENATLTSDQRETVSQLMSSAGLEGGEIEDGADGYSLEWELFDPIDEGELRKKLIGLGFIDHPKYRNRAKG